jgi:UDP-3-O-[3-hydroxymyristoyl] glucosamine N-acyltransferase
MKLSKLSEVLDAPYENGSPDMEITGVAGIEDAVSGQLTFVANPKYAAKARTTHASAVIVAKDFPTIPAAILRSRPPHLRARDQLFYQPPQLAGCTPQRPYPSRQNRLGTHRTLRGDLMRTW